MQVLEVSAPAQWIRPTGAVNAAPTVVQTRGGRNESELRKLLKTATDVVANGLLP